VPRLTLPGERELGHLLIPRPEVSKAVLAVGQHAIKSAAFVRQLELVGRIENRELFRKGQAR
jgi:hypothetical protein